MDEPASVNLFISWSGSLAREVAAALRQWIETAFDNIKPWMSDTDIQAGQRGLGLIESQLAATSYGIIVLTQENQASPWLNFEAGALSKAVQESDDPRVISLLVDINSASDVTGPLTQFQMKLLDRHGVESAMQSVGQLVGLSPQVVAERVDAFWSRLEPKLAAAKNRSGRPIGDSKRPIEDVVDEVLSHVRALRRAEAFRDGRVAVDDIEFNNVTDIVSEKAEELGIHVHSVVMDYGVPNGANQINIAVDLNTTGEQMNDLLTHMALTVPHRNAAVFYSSQTTD